VVAELTERLLHHRSLDNLDGIGYRRGEELVIRPGLRVKDMDGEVPVPPYHLIDPDNYRMTVSRDNTRYGYLKNGGKRLLEFMLFSSRGCPYNCFFCSRNFGRQFNQHSPDNFIAHIEKVTSEYAPDLFYFGDELMTTRREWIVEFCQKYRAAGLEIPFRINARVDTVDGELLAILKEAGCYEVDLGIESGSPEILKEMNKGVNVAQNHQAIRLCQEAGLYASPTMVFGMPSETAATIRETRDFLIAADVRTFGGFFATAYPGSALFEYALSRGLITDVDKYMLEVDNAFKLVINYTRLSDDVLRRQVAGVADDVLYAWYKRRGAGSLRLGIMFARRRLRQYLRAAVSILRREGPVALVRRAFREIQARWLNKHTQVEYG
jgi:anaerobic magnesium-protoporphyrin IX monomethyl ester cyclase